MREIGVTGEFMTPDFLPTNTKRHDYEQSLFHELARRLGEELLERELVRIERGYNQAGERLVVTMSVIVDDRAKRHGLPHATVDVRPPEADPWPAAVDEWLRNDSLFAPNPPKPLDLDFTKSTAIVPHEGKK